MADKPEEKKRIVVKVTDMDSGREISSTVVEFAVAFCCCTCSSSSSSTDSSKK
jgi:hypothetical protein